MPDVATPLLIYAVLVFAGLLGAIGDSVLNQWARTFSVTWLLAAYATWLADATVLGFILHRGYFTFGIAVVLFLLVNSAGVLALDWRFFGEHPTIWQWIGIGFALIAILCIELGKRPIG